jgi:hypothetical protein
MNVSNAKSPILVGSRIARLKMNGAHLTKKTWFALAAARFHLSISAKSTELNMWNSNADSAAPLQFGSVGKKFIS